MKTVLKLLFALSIFVFSCRQIPKDEDLINESVSSKNLVSVNLKLNEMGYMNKINDNPLISENNTRGGVILL